MTTTAITNDVKKIKTNAPCKKYFEVPLSAVEPKGWLRTYLCNQKDGLTGNLDRCGEPFDNEGWLLQKVDLPKNTLGWEFWFVYEQHGYWVDAMLKTGILIDDQLLAEKSLKQINYILNNPDSDGYLGPDSLKAEKLNNRWSHAVFFRAVIAYYQVCKDNSIIDKLVAHYKSKTSTHTLFRDVCNIEIMLWLYEQTGDIELLDASKEAYEQFDRLYEDTDMSLKSLASDKIATEHGVTFNEISKLGAILYMYTGNDKYLKPVVNGYKKIERDHLLVAGVCSSQEKLSGNDPLCCSEICDIADYPWSLGYLLFATGDTRYADIIERAAFNAAPGAVTKDFKASQYLSCPNQVIADEFSNHVFYRRGNERLSYRANHTPSCCPANVNRIMPNYTSRMWLIDHEGAITAALYAPSVLKFTTVDGSQYEVQQQTDYPFSDSISFRFKTSKPSEFTFKFRVPGWCNNAKWFINGVQQSHPLKQGSFQSVNRCFEDGDNIELILPFETRVLNWGDCGISLEAGPLVFSLPIDSQISKITTGEKCSEEFPALNLLPKSKWNYALDIDKNNIGGIKLIKNNCSNPSWSSEQRAWKMQVKARQIIGWTIEHQTEVDVYLPSGTDLAHKMNIIKKTGDFRFTPQLPDKQYIKNNLADEAEIIELVPYGYTLLRLTIFPSAK